MSPQGVDPVVSVIIPAYGRQHFLREGLRAILDGGYPALDVIVIDDGSPEDITTGLIAEFEGEPIRFIRQQNAGTAAARNHGVSLARGEFLLLVDDDDLVIADSIRWRVERMRAQPEVVAVAGRCRFLRACTPLEDEPVRWSGALTHWDLLARNRFYSPGQLLIRRSAFDRTVGFRREFLGSDDWDLWLQLTEHGPMLVDERFALLYRLHDGNYSRNVITMRRGAHAVADMALRGLCPRHAAVGRFLAYEFISDVYGDKLEAARVEAETARNRKQAMIFALEAMHLKGVTVTARIRQKVALIHHYHRLRMTHAQIEALGRECTDCQRARPLPLDGLPALAPV